jgi:hypothetical protein
MFGTRLERPRVTLLIRFDRNSKNIMDFSVWVCHALYKIYWPYLYFSPDKVRNVSHCNLHYT